MRIAPLAEALEVPPSQSRRFGDLVGESLALREVFAVLDLAAKSFVTVLLEGETGTGKELAARALHEHGPRRRGPFVAIDCAALPETLVESELFGHVRGAFTGARAARDGAFVRADGGTLFLDELDSVSPAVQARLLRAIEERAVRPVGADAERRVDVRVVAASRSDLSALVAAGSSSTASRSCACASRRSGSAARTWRRSRGSSSCEGACAIRGRSRGRTSSASSRTTGRATPASCATRSIARSP